MSVLVGNMLVAQSGDPTCAVNASLAGVIVEAGKHPELIEELYGSVHGIGGILDERLIDLQEEKQQTVLGIRLAPGAALGAGGHRIDPVLQPDLAAVDLQRLFEVFAAHNIRYFFCVGGRQCQTMLHWINQEARRRAYDLRVIGIPTACDNTVAYTDHTPGYGSIVKACATSVLEIGLDVAASPEPGLCCFIAVKGGTAGWVAAGTALARRNSHDAPHLVLMPEAPVATSLFLERVQATAAALGHCVVVVSDGMRDEAGRVFGSESLTGETVGGSPMPGPAELAARLVAQRLQLPTRVVNLGDTLRAASHLASATDLAEAFECGSDAVLSAINGQTGFVVKLVRASNAPYRATIGLQPLGDLVNMQNLVPREWIAEDGLFPNDRFLQYARPLILGEVELRLEAGLPRYATLDRVPVETRLAPRGGGALSPTEPVMDPA